MSNNTTSSFAAVVKPLVFVTLFLSVKWILGSYSSVENKQLPEVPLPQIPSSLYSPNPPEGLFPRKYSLPSALNEQKTAIPYLTPKFPDGKRELGACNTAEFNDFTSRLLLAAIPQPNEKEESPSDETTSKSQESPPQKPVLFSDALPAEQAETEPKPTSSQTAYDKTDRWIEENLGHHLDLYNKHVLLKENLNSILDITAELREARQNSILTFAKDLVGTSTTFVVSHNQTTLIAKLPDHWEKLVGCETGEIHRSKLSTNCQAYKPSVLLTDIKCKFKKRYTSAILLEIETTCRQEASNTRQQATISLEVWQSGLNLNARFPVTISAEEQSKREFVLSNEIEISEQFDPNKPMVILVSLNDHQFGTQLMDETLRSATGEPVSTLSNTLGIVYCQNECLKLDTVR